MATLLLHLCHSQVDHDDRRALLWDVRQLAQRLGMVLLVVGYNGSVEVLNWAYTPQPDRDAGAALPIAETAARSTSMIKWGQGRKLWNFTTASPATLPQVEFVDDEGHTTRLSSSDHTVDTIYRDIVAARLMSKMQ